MKNYGLPYQGSKQKIIDFIISNLPPSAHLYDMFAGGGSVTCAALASGMYKHVHSNDINKHSLFLESCINDNVPGLFRWVSWSEYFEKRDVDDMAFFCYSFSSNGQDYIYSMEIEPYKKALYYARVHKDFTLLDAMSIMNNRHITKEAYIKYYVRNVLRMPGNVNAIFQKLQRIIDNKERQTKNRPRITARPARNKVLL